MPIPETRGQNENASHSSNMDRARDVRVANALSLPDVSPYRPRLDRFLTWLPLECHKPPPASPLMKPRVLIVDDEPDVLELVDFKLSAQGFEVLKAANGIEALRRARCDSPDVIVLDVMLPDLDGFSICEILRAQPST